MKNKEALMEGPNTWFESFMVNEKPEKVSMCKVQSSNIEALGILLTSGDKLPSLVVKFYSGGIFLYRNIALDKINELISSESVGTYFSKNIKPKYGFVKIFPVLQKVKD